VIYVTNSVHKAELVPQLRQIFSNAEGIDKVYGVEEFSELGLPVPAVSDQAPDLMLAATPDYMFSSESEGNFVTHVSEAGTHGYINTDPKMQAIFMAWGAGIPKGVRLKSISNLDVAPTIAALLGLDMKQVNGHPIREIVEQSAGPKTIQP
jgi:predicted AlkP superfamily pyrophosphatase or phosphodiesterase